MNQSNIRQIKLESITKNPWNTRQGEPDPAYIKELALDIADKGMLQIPIGRFYDPNDKTSPVQLAFGHNRLAAYRWLYDLRDNSDIPGDWSAMPIDVRTLTDEQMAVYSWSENEKRRDVTAIERARAIKNRLDSFKWSNRECAEALGVDHSTISNLLRLLKLPEDLQQAILDGRISERQAMAILPVYEAPDGHHGQGNIYYYTNPESIAGFALEGESSVALRGRVERYFSAASSDLSLAEFKLDQLFPEGEAIYCGLCKTCDRRMPSRNRCFDSECFHAKTAYVHREYLMKASQASGYGIIDDKKGGYPSDLPWEEEKFERILATKCPNLVLDWTPESGKHCIVDGYPHARLVCEKRNDSCTCVKGLKMLSSLGSAQSTGQPLSQVFTEGANQSWQEGDNDDYNADDAQEDIEESESSGQTDSIQSNSFQMPAPLSPEELEDAARQARRDKRAVGDQMPAVREKLEDHLYQALTIEEATGVLFVVAHNSIWPYGSDLERDQLYRYMAKKAAQTLMPSSAESLTELLKSINHHLGNLKLEQLVIDETEAV